jgi:hypothetical protein
MVGREDYMRKVALGIVVGFLLAVGVLIAGRHFFGMTIPFEQDSLGRGTHSHMKLFVHDVTKFHPGSFDTDTYHIWFRFGTRIQTAAEYFDRVDTGIRGSEWKLLDRHGGFSLYVNEWQKVPHSAARLAIALNYDPETRTVSFEEQRRYE